MTLGSWSYTGTGTGFTTTVVEEVPDAVYPAEPESVEVVTTLSLEHETRAGTRRTTRKTNPSNLTIFILSPPHFVICNLKRGKIASGLYDYSKIVPKSCSLAR
jgi:hypothetical protein